MTDEVNNSGGGFDQRNQHVDQQINVAGTYNDYRTIVQAVPPRLRASFEAYISGKLKDFIGRQFVFNALDEFIRNNPAGGYFIIRGAPGMGKSSLLSKLIRDRGYIHHFNIATQNIRSPRAFLENVCSQLVSRYKLPYTPLPPNAGDDGNFLQQCLYEAAGDSKNHPIVLAVDSLDESDRTGLAEGANSLYLPSYLPEGVFVILTTRPLDDMHLQVDCLQVQFDLKPDDENNAKDIEAYIANFIKQDAMRARLEAQNVTDKDFIVTMREKSEGNFMYLYHVLPAFRDGLFKDDSLDKLPNGLEGFYKRHWREMQEGKKEKFEEIYARIVCILGVAQQPVTKEQIAAWTNLTPFKVSESIQEWREFLIEEEKEASQHFRIYHRSFQNFLSKQVDLTQFDDMISNYYLSLNQVTA